MKNAIIRRLNALEAKSGVGHRPFVLAFFDGPRDEHTEEVVAATTEAEVNGEQLMAIFFVPPNG